MKTITRTDLRQLAETMGEHLISIYMPTYTGAEAQQNEIRYKNLLSAAEAALIERGTRSSEARARLARVSDELQRAGVWDEQGPSLAVFVGSEDIRFWRIPAACPEQCRIGDYFHLTPLLAWLSSDAPYYVLAVSQNQVRLYYGRRDGLEPVEVPRLPRDLDDALRLDDPEPARQQHAAARGTPGKQGLVFHGQGGAPDEAKQEVLAFCREIDRALADVLRQRSEPLIFAGVDYLFPIYQEANTYRHLLATPVTGNPELWAAHELRERAWPLVEAILSDRREAAIRSYGNSIPLKQALERTEEIVLAAHAGAIDTLLLDPSARVTGAFDAEGLTVHVDEQPRAESEDLVSLAATLVLRSSGAVEPLDAGRIPGGGAMAAVLRYPFPAKRVTPGGTRRQATEPAEAARGG